MRAWDRVLRWGSVVGPFVLGAATGERGRLDDRSARKDTPGACAVGDRDLRQDEGQLSRSQASVFALPGGERIGEGEAPCLPSPRVDQVSDLGTAQQGAQLVSEEVEVVRLPVAQVVTRQGATPGEIEAVLETEERVEDLDLQWGEAALGSLMKALPAPARKQELPERPAHPQVPPQLRPGVDHFGGRGESPDVGVACLAQDRPEEPRPLGAGEPGTQLGYRHGRVPEEIGHRLRIVEVGG